MQKNGLNNYHHSGLTALIDRISVDGAVGQPLVCDGRKWTCRNPFDTFGRVALAVLPVDC